MQQLFIELRARLLGAGVAPRHVRRYLRELSDHLDDLCTEERGAGRDSVEAEAAALARLGKANDLASAMLTERRFQSWSARAPWAVFSLVPLCCLLAFWLVAFSILLSGWILFLPDSTTPFVPTHGFSAVYFGVGRLLYFCAPVLVGWGILLIAARQRSKTLWPTVGLVLTAWLGGMAQVSVNRSEGWQGVGSIHVGGIAAPGMSGSLTHFLVLLGLSAVPYLIWRLSLRGIAAD